MKKIKTLKKWGIYELNEKEQKEYLFKYAVIHPENMEVGYKLEPTDTDVDLDSLESAISWIENY